MERFTIQAFWAQTNRLSPNETCRSIVDYLHQIRRVHPVFHRWFLKSTSLEAALTNEIVHESDLAKRIPPPSRDDGIVLGLWNGMADSRQGVSMRIVDGWKNEQVKNGFVLSLPPVSTETLSVFSQEGMLALLLPAIDIWNPYWASVLPVAYEGTKSVFPDRRGVGWMAYVNAIIDARILLYGNGFSLVPTGGGTILVATSELFSVARSDHVHAANQIEIHLAELGLLPKL